MSRHSELHHDYRARATRLQEHAASIVALQQLLVDAHTAAAVLLSAGSGEASERVSGGDTSNPVLDRVFARAWVQTHLADVDQHVVDMAASVIAAQRVLTQLAAAGRRSSGSEAPPRTNMVDCQACQRTITMTPDDRPRGGYCNACRMAWQRLQHAHEGPGAPDRVVFERNRAKWAGLDDPPVVRTAGSRITEITRDGVTVAVTEAQSAALLAGGPSISAAAIDALFAESQ